MHICCAPCANQPIEVLRTDGIEVAGFWYNPNIHPVTEYRARRNCVESYAKEIEEFGNKYAHLPITWEADDTTYSLKYNLAFDKILKLIPDENKASFDLELIKSFIINCMFDI